MFVVEVVLDTESVVAVAVVEVARIIVSDRPADGEVDRS